MTGVVSHVRPRRAAHEKSRTGCVTCKTRRVKCDETQPECRRCTDSGRRCEGPTSRDLLFVRAHTYSHSHSYTYTRAPVTTPPPWRPERSLSASPKDHDERRAFHFFVHRTAPLFAGAMDAAFWTDLVPRLAHSNPVVWDIAVSTSWLFEYVPFTTLEATHEASPPRAPVNWYHRRVLNLYNRAIANLRGQIGAEGVPGISALVSCVLFACLEFQQRNVGNARLLMKHGYQIMDGLLTNPPPSPLPAVTQEIQEIVLPFFSRHATLTATIGDPSPPDWDDYLLDNALPATIAPMLSVLDDVRGQLYQLTYQGYEMVRVAVLLAHDDEELEKMKPSQRALLAELAIWRDKFADEWGQLPPGHVQWAVHSMLLHWSVCVVWLQTCTSPLQTSFDQHRALFLDMIQRAEAMLRHSRAVAVVTADATVTAERGLVPSLFFCGTKCRDPVIRRQAVRLLGSVPRHHQSTWDCVLTRAMADKVIATEEGHKGGHRTGCSPDGAAPGPEPPYHLPPEEDRIHHVAVVGSEPWANRRRICLQFSRFDVEPNRTRKMVHRNVWLDLDAPPGG